jgi:hypothetical protein
MFLSGASTQSTADHITSGSSHLDDERWHMFSKIDKCGKPDHFKATKTKIIDRHEITSLCCVVVT